MPVLEPTRSITKCGLSILMTTVTALSNSGSSHLKKKLLTIFVPGYSCRSSDFSALISLLASAVSDSNSRYSEQIFVSVDLPGHGETPQSVCSRPSVEKFAALVNEVRDEVIVGAKTEDGTESSENVDVLLVGHSLGARNILEIRLQDPRGIVGMVFVDGSHYRLRPKGYLEQQKATFGKGDGNENGISDQRPSGHSQQETRSPEEIRLERNKAIELLFSTMFSPLTPPPFKEKAMADAKASMDYLIPLRRSHMMWDQEKMDEAVQTLSIAKIPVLVLQATDGSGVERRSLAVGEQNGWMEFLRERVDAGMYEGVVVEACGHFPHVDRVDRVEEVLGKWMAKRIDERDQD